MTIDEGRTDVNDDQQDPASSWTEPPGPNLAEVVAALERRVTAQESLLEAQRQQIAELTDRSARHEGSEPAVLRADRSAPAAELPDQPTEGRHAVGRRGLLAGAAGAVAATAVGLFATSEPAAANTQGQSWTLGGANSATATTSLTGSLSNAPVLSIANSTSGGSGVVATAGTTTGFGGRAAVVGDSHDDDGVLGQSTRIGVHGRVQKYTGSFSATGFGVYGEADSEVGVTGVSRSGTAILGHADTGYGVQGESNSGIASIFQAGSGDAVLASTGSGTALRAIGLDSGSAGIDVSGNLVDVLFSGRGRQAPTSDTVAHTAGSVVFETNGALWLCTESGTPGVWRRLGGYHSAGALSLLPVPVRVYDSRVGTQPAVGPKTALTASTARTVDLTANSSGLPAGASGALVTLLVVNASAGNANLTMWANGATRPSSNTMVWGGSTGRFSTQAITALDSAGKCQLLSSIRTDIVVDVVGYYQ